MEPPPAPGSAGTGDGFQVCLDRRTVDATMALVLLLQLVPLVLVVALGALLLSVDGVGTTAVAVPVVVLGLVALFPPLMGMLAWSRSRRVDVPIELYPLGLHLRGSAGEVYAPWEAVASVTVEPHLTGRQLRIRLVPGDDPRRGGVVQHVPSRWRRTFDRQGIRYSLRILAVDPRRLAEELAVQSAGRVTVAL